MSGRQRIRRRLSLAFWRLFNPLARALAGIAPWWVVLETTGRRSGRRRQVPLAKGPVDGDTAWLIAVHGRHSAFAHNIAADPRVRLRITGRWRIGRAELVAMDEATLARFSRYARTGHRTMGMDPMLVRVALEPPSGAPAPAGAPATKGADPEG